MKKNILVPIALCLILTGWLSPLRAQVSADSVLTPPLGWNSWDCFSFGITETEVKATADFMSEKLLQYGYKYLVIDMGWYYSTAVTANSGGMSNPPMSIDNFGRQIPDTVKFPSATDSLGFKQLADYVHSKGLKFGIHIMRGIPWKAASLNTPIHGTDSSALQVADYKNVCAWSKAMVGLNMNLHASQEYYNSVFKLYASWGVDYVKVDDIAREFHDKDMVAITEAIKNCGRPMVLSLSPGPAPLKQAAFFQEYANLYRISNDFWDHWKFVSQQMSYCEKWYPYILPGHWPDADMLPFGKLRKTGGDSWVAGLLGDNLSNIGDELSRFTDLEKQTIMSLWCIFRSPIMYGGYLPESDSVSLALITNPEALEVNQHSSNNRLFKKLNNNWTWLADNPETGEKYLALFNLNNAVSSTLINLRELGMDTNCILRDLWTHQDLGIFSEGMHVSIEAHGSRLYKLTPTGSEATHIDAVPEEYSVHVFPNPVNGRAQIEILLEKRQAVELKVISQSGQLIKVLCRETLPAGKTVLPFDAGSIPAGICYIRFKAGSRIETCKLVIKQSR